MNTMRSNLIGAVLVVTAISGMAACGSAAAKEPPSNGPTLTRVAELSAIAHYANTHGLIGGSPVLLHPAP
jgi:hypothetical protein